jgi:hypothetical protein
MDREGKELATRAGVTEISPGAAVLLFEGDFTFDREPGAAAIEFNKDDLAQWVMATAGRSDVVTKNQHLKNVFLKPRFEVTLLNTDLVNDADALLVGAVVYDAGRKPVGISRTFVEGIPKGEEQKIFFTWPHGFTGASAGNACTDSSCSESNFLTDIIMTPRAIFRE